ncbi:stage II sporulation protein M [Pseudokineococcus marinus]|uniref:Stage II sporulation protein M n=1 Tax=Pseudokineococcus marinus TaxID=351215 RepID=A0A849BJ17_9ACTN|nr:stage II sporulation protein M [Pseudokineococcus marinus]NNH23180.1 stage II sporulation protein M [Pseudokineococcus marinus]
MDVDAFVQVHEPTWQRLERLLRQGRLRGEDADELLRLYQRTATHLSVLQASSPDPVLVSRLSRLVARARSRIGGVREPAWREVARFLLVSFPVAVYRIRWVVVGVAAAFLVMATAVAVWTATDPAVLASMGGEQDLRQYVERDFVDYYSQNTAASFAGQVWSNNARIAALCVAFGITGVFVVYIVAANAVGVGQAAGLLFAYDRGDVFFAFILPHGFLELTAVFVAAAAGLALFWAWVAPGARTRADALAAEGRALFTIALGLVGVLAVSGVVEGFVTPAPWPTPVRVGVGFLVFAAFCAYVGVLGRRAAALGETGDLRAGDVGDVAPVRG